VAGIPVAPRFVPVLGASIHLTVQGAGPAVAIPDPAAGDRVWVVPVPGPGKGIGIARSFAEVELLATAQGIAGRALGDGVKFRTLRQGVEITAPGGLSLSGTNVSGIRTAAARGKRARELIGGESWLFEIKKLYQGDGDAFAAIKHRFLETAYKAGPTEQSRARSRLAQLHFAHSLYTDVIAILRVVEVDDPKFVNDPVFRALRGASYFSLGDQKRARLDLFHASLDPYNEISLWRGAVEAVDGKWAEALRYFSRSDSVIRSYPRGLRIRFGLLAAETAWHVGDVPSTKYHLAVVESLKPGRSFTPRLYFMRGHLLAKTLNPDDAVAYWNRAIDGSDPRTRVRAALAKNEILLKHGRIDLKKVAEELEKLRFVWRGDALEFELLTRLGRAYLDTGDFKNGLLTLRDAVRNYPKHPETDGVVNHMRDAYVNLFDGALADKLPPLVSLALYDEFRELTPPGKAGNELIAKLAHRLVAVDLLDRAATLLEHLVEERLTGTERLEAANQLGLVYLMDRKPDRALATLGGEVPADIAPKVVVSRRLLTARALGELTRYSDALALLKSEKSRDAELLRAEIYWRLKNWGEAAKAYGALVDIDGTKQTGFSETRQRYVLNLIISLALSGNVKGLDWVRKRFAARMDKTRYREAFNLVSGHSGPVPNSYWLITQKVAEVDLFRTFMKSYREKLLPVPGKPKGPGKTKRRAENAAPAPTNG
jgi:tetratricopeptide (TPR) repeat protein